MLHTSSHNKFLFPPVILFQNILFFVCGETKVLKLLKYESGLYEADWCYTFHTFFHPLLRENFRLKPCTKMKVTNQKLGTRWRSWMMQCATSLKVAGSNPDGVTGFFD
jgi:hypothetical protein